MTPLAQERLAGLWLAEYDNVASFVRRRLHSPELAEDITMQSFTELGEMLEAKPGRVDKLAQGSLLQSLAQRRIIDHIRSAVFRGPHVALDEQIDSPADEMDQYQEYVDLEFAVGLDSAIRGLPEQARDAFILTDLRGLTVREASAVMGLGKSRTDELVQSARTTIREELAA